MAQVWAFTGPAAPTSGRPETHTGARGNPPGGDPQGSPRARSALRLRRHGATGAGRAQVRSVHLPGLRAAAPRVLLGASLGCGSCVLAWRQDGVRGTGTTSLLP